MSFCMKVFINIRIFIYTIDTINIKQIAFTILYAIVTIFPYRIQYIIKEWLIIVESQTNIKKSLLIPHKNSIDSLNYRQLLLKFA